jgi:hypothetical protein
VSRDCARPWDAHWDSHSPRSEAAILYSACIFRVNAHTHLDLFLLMPFGRLCAVLSPGGVDRRGSAKTTPSLRTRMEFDAGL